MKFTKDHEWIKLEGNIATVGITQYAADALGELVYVELPKIGNSYNKGSSFAVVESSKSASDVYLPIQGKIIEINNSLINNPELINNSPYQEGWIAKVEIVDSNDLANTLDESEYNLYLQQK
jgi:glycine cleavage system H protein